MKRISRSIWLLVAAVTAIASLNLVVLARRGVSSDTGTASVAPTVSSSALVAAPGVVEPKSESVRVGAQIGGRLAEVLVDEGDRVTKGQVIARIANDDYRARVASAEAELAAREADARRTVNGARSEERRAADADLLQAEADLEHAKADHRRASELFEEKVISRAEMDRAEQALKVSVARADALRERRALVDSQAREEDVARADADVAQARARLNEARALLDKTFVTSPIDGVVLRRHARTGESVSTQFDSPIVTLADRSSTRVRVDVDETDVARIKVGQAAYVTADAFGLQRFAGRVIRVGQILGKKNVRTDEPTERVDQKVLETLIELEDGHELPLGLRVRTFLQTTE
jgi:ABC exporter DevB family membrane fusion protein